MEETLAATGIVAVIVARMNSQRLPGKPLLPLGETTVLDQVVRRIRASHFGKRVIVATTNDPSDAPLRAHCAVHNIPCYAGSAENILERTVEAARMLEASIVLRCTVNSVLLDPQMLDACAFYAWESGMDYITIDRLPVGAVVEAMPLRTLQHIAEPSADNPTADFALLRGTPTVEFERALLPAPPRLCRPDARLMLETEEDYRFLSRLYSEVAPRYDGLIHLEDAIAYWERELASTGPTGHRRIA